MKETTSFVTQSKFFSPVFNAAIFDGPIRIYFAQYQESQALKVYFNLQERYKDIRHSARYTFQKRGGNIFIMLYPSVETFELCFAGQSAQIVSDRLGADFIIGVRDTLEDNDFAALYEKLDVITQAQAELLESLLAPPHATA